MACTMINLWSARSSMQPIQGSLRSDKIFKKLRNAFEGQQRFSSVAESTWAHIGNTCSKTVSVVTGLLFGCGILNFRLTGSCLTFYSWWMKCMLPYIKMRLNVAHLAGCGALKMYIPAIPCGVHRNNSWFNYHIYLFVYSFINLNH